jgi:hypothetical protein
MILGHAKNRIAARFWTDGGDSIAWDLDASMTCHAVPSPVM